MHTSAVIPFHRPMVSSPARDPYLSEAARATEARVVFVRTSVRAHCHRLGHSSAVMASAVTQALTQLANGQTREFAIDRGTEHADLLAKREADARGVQ